MCVYIVFLPLTNILAKRPWYMALMCTDVNMSILHVAAACPCNMSPRMGPPLGPCLQKKNITVLQMEKNCNFGSLCSKRAKDWVRMPKFDWVLLC